MSVFLAIQLRFMPAANPFLNKIDICTFVVLIVTLNCRLLWWTEAFAVHPFWPRFVAALVITMLICNFCGMLYLFGRGALDFVKANKLKIRKSFRLKTVAVAKFLALHKGNPNYYGGAGSDWYPSKASVLAEDAAMQCQRIWRGHVARRKLQVWPPTRPRVGLRSEPTSVAAPQQPAGDRTPIHGAPHHHHPLLGRRGGGA